MKVPCERPSCRKSFEPAQNKRFCSERCRVLRHYERVDESSRRLWNSLEPIDAESAFKARSEPEWLKMVLTRNAPSGAAGYRLGCPNRFTSEESQYLRWFPSMDGYREMEDASSRMAFSVSRISDSSLKSFLDSRIPPSFSMILVSCLLKGRMGVMRLSGNGFIIPCD